MEPDKTLSEVNPVNGLKSYAARPNLLRTQDGYRWVTELGEATTTDITTSITENATRIINDADANTKKITDNATANKDAIVAALTALDKRAQQILALMNDPVNITKTLPASLIETQTAKATAIVTLRDDTQVSSADHPDDFEWASSDESVITVEADGTLHALQAGMASISVVYLHQLESEGANVNVEAKKVTSVAILSTEGEAPTTSIPAGDSIQLRAQATYNTGDKSVLFGSSASWTSSDTDVATVESGTITGVTAGTANITATIEGVASPALAFTVTPPNVNIAIFNADNPNGKEISTYVLPAKTGTTVAFKDADGNKIIAESYRSSYQSRATVADDGAITAVGPGETTITATYKGKTATIKINAGTGDLTRILVAVANMTYVDAQNPGADVTLGGGTVVQDANGHSYSFDDMIIAGPSPDNVGATSASGAGVVADVYATAMGAGSAYNIAVGTKLTIAPGYTDAKLLLDVKAIITEGSWSLETK